jgi:hypothetical protein
MFFRYVPRMFVLRKHHLNGAVVGGGAGTGAGLTALLKDAVDLPRSSIRLLGEEVAFQLI